MNRFGVIQLAGEFHVHDRHTGAVTVIGSPAAGRLGQYADCIDPSDGGAAWQWEQVLNCFPADAETLFPLSISV